MHRKVQVFSKPGKVSIGQDRNKKDPRRGRKPKNQTFQSTLEWYRNKKDPRRGRKPHIVLPFIALRVIETKKIPVGDGNKSRSLLL